MAIWHFPLNLVLSLAFFHSITQFKTHTHTHERKDTHNLRIFSILYSVPSSFCLQTINCDSKSKNNISVKIRTGGDQFKLFDVLFYILFFLFCLTFAYEQTSNQIFATVFTGVNANVHNSQTNHVLTTALHIHIFACTPANDNSIYMNVKNTFLYFKIRFVIKLKCEMQNKSKIVYSHFSFGHCNIYMQHSLCWKINIYIRSLCNTYFTMQKL